MKVLPRPRIKITCPDCLGKKKCITSCCTGEVIHGDIPMCPICKEWCGEYECQFCDGTGKIEK